MRSLRAGRVTLAFLVVLGLSCNDSTGPSASYTLPVAFSINLAGGASAAFDAADLIHITIVGDDITVFDEVLPFSSAGQDVSLRIPVDASLNGELLDVSVELRRGADPLFRGSATVAAGSGETDPVDILLEPVIAAVVPHPDALIPAIGATLQLNAAAVFATGDTVPNVTIAYQLLDQGIILLQPGGIAVGESEGTARVRASAGGRSVDFDVEVRIVALTVTVDPAQAIVGIGGTLRLVAQARDAAGLPVNRAPTWSSANTTVATVTSAGVVTGVAAGTAIITATVDAAQGTSRIEVSTTPRPATPTGVIATASGTAVTLAWQDNATNETSYEVRRGPAGGALTTVASLPADSRGFDDTGLPVDQVLDYVVSACNQQVCSPSDRVTTRTVPIAPTGLVVLQSSPSSLSFRLGWTDTSTAETEFRIEALDAASGQFAVLGTVPAGTVQFDGTGTASTTGTYRVLACNPAGCSAASNVVTISFGAEPPVAVTLPTVTSTELVGSTDADGQLHDWWFEYYYDPSFVDANVTMPVSTTSAGLRIEPLFDLESKEPVYYRIVAQNAAGTTYGSTQFFEAPVLESQSAAPDTVCNAGSGCSVYPQTITFTAISTGDVYTYQGFQFVSFDLEFPFTTLGSGTVMATPNYSTGIVTFTYSLTIDPSTVAALMNSGQFEVVVRGYPASSSGNVVSTPIPFVVASF